jgi:arylsulfatase A-like enzyme
LSALDEPFAWFMRDAGGHAPYDRFDEHLQTDESVQSYLQQHGGNVSRIRSDYADAVDSSVKRFRRFVLKPLEERGLRDQTLIVFVSDHGQLLGEYGHVGESYPSAPEVVKIPTTLIHPDLPTGEQASQLMRHVDLPPVVAGLVDPKCPVGAVDGEDVRSTENSPEMGLNYYDRLFPSVVGQFNYAIESVWDWKGGHAFLESPMWNRLKLFAGFVTQIPAGIHFRRERSLEGLKLLFQSEQTWGDPGFTVAEARKQLASFDRADDGDLQMTAGTQEQLEDLGYL